MSNRRDNQFLWNPHNRATKLDCSFVVNDLDAAGAGVTGFSGSGRVSSAYMFTQQTPAAKNPNPNAGYIVVNLMDNYDRYLGLSASFTPPLDASVTAVVAGSVYQIVSLGTATLAQWQAKGLAASITPAVGASFVAIASGSIGGSATVSAPLGSGIDHIEVVGDPDVMNAELHISGAQVNGGMQIILACYAGGVITAPAMGSQINLELYLNNSAQGV